MFLVENTFAICLLPVCQPASLPGSLEFRKTSINLKELHSNSSVIVITDRLQASHPSTGSTRFISHVKSYYRTIAYIVLEWCFSCCFNLFHYFYRGHKFQTVSHHLKLRFVCRYSNFQKYSILSAVSGNIL